MFCQSGVEMLIKINKFRRLCTRMIFKNNINIYLNGIVGLQTITHGEEGGGANKVNPNELYKK